MKFVELQKNPSQLVAQNTTSLNFFFYNTVDQLQEIEALLFNEILSIKKQTKELYHIMTCLLL